MQGVPYSKAPPIYGGALNLCFYEFSFNEGSFHKNEVEYSERIIAGEIASIAVFESS